jgi:hypothetical protein
MKISLFSALVSAAVLTGLHASATPLPTTIVGPLTINWTLLTAKLVESPKYPAPGKTTVTGSGFARTTNILQVYTSSDTSTPGFGNANFLGLLANSLGMTFPAGTKLVTDGNGGVYVVDHTGTNQIVDSATVAKVITVSLENDISSGVRTVTEAIKFSSTNTTSVQTHAGSQFVTLNYDDSALQTTDGTKTTFQFIGISASSSKSTETTSSASANDVVKGSGSFTIHGYGSGTIRDQNHLIQGTIMGTPSGTETAP